MSRRLYPAFTLLETVLAVGLFVLLSSVVIDVLLSSGRTERQGVAREQVVASARAALELMVRELRLGTPTSWGFDGRLPFLLIRRNDGLSTVYYGFVPGRLSTCTMPTGGTTCSQFDLRSIVIERATVVDFKVYTWPASDPYAPGATVNEQARTTVALTVRSRGGINEAPITSTVQTTVVSRRYVR